MSVVSSSTVTRCSDPSVQVAAPTDAATIYVVVSYASPVPGPGTEPLEWGFGTIA